MDDLCTICGRPIQVGDYPCISRPRPHEKSSVLAIEDSIIGGFVQEHFGVTPETFYSKKAMAKRADDLGLQPFVRHVEGDKHVAKWV